MMSNENTAACFETNFEKGKLFLPGETVDFAEIPWAPHAKFEGVALKHLVRASHTNGEFSFHLVRVAPGRKIGVHVHERQLETHEVIAGVGVCVNDGVELEYRPGVVSFFPCNLPHEIRAGEEGLYLFAKFFPALC